MALMPLPSLLKKSRSLYGLLWKLPLVETVLQPDFGSYCPSVSPANHGTCPTDHVTQLSWVPYDMTRHGVMATDDT